MNDNTTPRHANRLIDETSPYLLQHAHNPVDWYPWGEAAFARARDENKPIFLSIGYAACHWCHVMERESFENEDIARLLNEHFVSVKVDREERPDLDDLYMQAVQLLTGSGGWPMSVFLTPEGRPFFGGTYFPPEDHYGRIGFRRLLLRIYEVLTQEPDKVAKNGEMLVGAIADNLAVIGAPGLLTHELVAGAVEGLRGRFDPNYGGFGGAPKFPPSMALNLLLREYRRTGDLQLLQMVEVTLARMADGGMYDQLAGGFHRYSTDHVWLVPHFEKMLYDNALLAPVYFDAALATGNVRHERIGREILEYVLNSMTHTEGGFYSTQDADSEGHEGKYYTWRPEEIEEVLHGAGFSPEDIRLFIDFHGVTPQGNWHEAHAGGSILNIPVPLDEFARRQKQEPEQLRARLDAMRAPLLAARARRIPPLLDDKVLTSWNGLMISAMARGAQVTGEARYARAARAAADFIERNLRAPDGRLLHSWRNGQAKVEGLLEDYACLMVGLIDLYETTFDAELLARAEGLAERLLAEFYDSEAGGFYTTNGRDATVLVRLKDFYDGATPSGNAMAVTGLLRLGLLLDRDAYRDAARGTLRVMVDQLSRLPAAHHMMLCALADDLAPPSEIAIIADPTSRETRAVLHALWREYLPARVMAAAPAGDPAAGRIALLRDRPGIDQQVAIYICREYACAAPVSTAAEAIPLLK